MSTTFKDALQTVMDVSVWPCHSSMTKENWLGWASEAASFLRQTKRGIPEGAAVKAALAVSKEHRFCFSAAFLECFKMGVRARWAAENYAHTKTAGTLNPYRSRVTDGIACTFMYCVWRYGWEVADWVRIPMENRTPTGRLKQGVEQLY